MKYSFHPSAKEELNNSVNYYKEISILAIAFQ
jgi:hypothetical protein